MPSESYADGKPLSAEDAAIVRCRDGDASAFRAIYDQHGTHLYRLAILITRDGEQAKDVVQETFIRAWRKIGQYRIGTDLQSWLITILLNEARSWQRRVLRRARLVRQVPLELAELEVVEATYVDDPFRHGEVLKAFTGLNSDQRVVIALRYHVGMTVPEIAERTGASEGTVKSRIHRALEKMRTELESPTVNVAADARACAKR